MSEDTQTALPATMQDNAAMRTLIGDRASPAIQIMLNDHLWERCTQIAQRMARAEGAIPRHLLNKPEACFAVVVQSMTWKLDPHAVARCTYQTPGGQLGFFGSLCQAILENSGRIKGQIKFEHFGDWDKIQGKFIIKSSDKGGKYAAPDWKPELEEGLGVVVSAQIHGEEEPRTFSFLLKQAFPRNSTLWATDPKTQICYTAVRRFSSVAAPAIFMGVPFDREDFAESGQVIEHDATALPARPAKPPTAKAAKNAGASMDREFKETVGEAKTAPQETVIEDTGEVVTEQTTTQETTEPQPQQQEQQEATVAKEEPKRKKEEPAKQTAPTPPPEEAPAEPPPAEDEGDDMDADSPPLMTEAEAKKFCNGSEKFVVGFKGTNLQFSDWKGVIKPEYDRLKHAYPDKAQHLSKMIGDKAKWLKSKEAENMEE